MRIYNERESRYVDIKLCNTCETIVKNCREERIKASSLCKKCRNKALETILLEALSID